MALEVDHKYRQKIFRECFIIQCIHVVSNQGHSNLQLLYDAYLLLKKQNTKSIIEESHETI